MAQQGNPFYVTPALATADVAGTLRGVGHDLLSRQKQAFMEKSYTEGVQREQEKEQAALLLSQAQLQQKNTAIEQYIADPSSPENLSNVMKFAPDEAEQIDKQYKTSNDLQKDESLRSNIQLHSLLKNKDKEGALQNLIGRKKDLATMGEATPFIDRMIEDLQEDEGGIESVMGDIGIRLASNMDNEAVSEYLSPKDSTYQQGTGDMSGSVFNTETGTYTHPKGFVKPESQVEFKDFRSLNNDVTTYLKPVRGINSAANSLIKLKKSSSSVDQLAAIFKLMKSLDPTSVVRDSEQQMAASSGGVADTFRGYINNLQGGGKLTPEVFTKMVNTAKNMQSSAVETAVSDLQNQLDAYGERISKKDRALLMSRIPKALIQEPTIQSKARDKYNIENKKAWPNAKDVGYEQMGAGGINYQYIGGDPAEKSSWRAK